MDTQTQHMDGMPFRRTRDVEYKSVAPETLDLPAHDVFLVDRSRLFREGLKMLLRESSFRVIGEGADIAQSEPHLCERKTPLLILLALETDLHGDGNEEVAAITQIRSLAPETRVVVLTDKMCVQQLTLALEAGADGYLLKDITPEALKQSLSLVLIGEKVLPTELVKVLVNGGANRVSDLRLNTAMPSLSEREKQILSCLVDGHSNKTIAYQLKITEGTVKVHLKGVLKKISARNRTQAAIWALNHGFVAMNEAPH